MDFIRAGGERRGLRCRELGKVEEGDLREVLERTEEGRLESVTVARRLDRVSRQDRVVPGL